MLSSLIVINYLLFNVVEICMGATMPAIWVGNNYFVAGQYTFVPQVITGFNSPINQFFNHELAIPFTSAFPNPSTSLVALGLLDFDMNLADQNLYLHLSNEQVNDTSFKVSIEIIYKNNNYLLNKMRFRYLAVDPSFHEPFHVGYFINAYNTGNFLQGPFNQEFYVPYTLITGEVFNLEHQNVLVAFMHIFDISDVQNGCFDLNIQLLVNNTNVYKVIVSTACTMKLQKFGFSRIIFDKTQIQNHGYFFIEYGLNQTTNTQVPQLTITVQNFSVSDLMMGISSFTIQYQPGFSFTSALSSATTIQGQLTGSVNEFNFSYLYVRYRVCPQNYTFFQMSPFLCQEQFPAALVGCIDGADINNNLFCYQCQDPYVLSATSDCQIPQKIDNGPQNKLGYVLLGLSYSVFMLSTVSAKIVGLELMGLYQLSFLILVDQPLNNPLLRSLLNLRYSNGYNFDGSKSVDNTAENVRAINYSYSYLENFNLMLGTALFLLLVSLGLFLSSFKVPQMFKFSQISLKSVFVSFFIFSIYNMSFSLGLHYKYANQYNTALYPLNSIATVISLFVSVFVLFGLTFFENMLYGQYRTKFKQNFLMRKYIFLTIIKRFLLGFCMSYFNENENVALILLFVSFCFAFYSLSNLPFIQTYHNYRGNFCHVTELVIILTAYFYRTVIYKNNNTENPGSIGLAVVQVVMLVMSIGVAIVSVIYEIIFKRKQNNMRKLGNKTEGSGKDLGMNKDDRLNSSMYENSLANLAY